MRAILAAVLGALALVASQAPAALPACRPTPRQPEGPYYTPGAPFRRVLVHAGIPGARLVLTGRVLGPGCRPAAGAVLDFWQADAAGTYDNSGYRLRGRQRADARGRYRLVTVVPGLYSGRTRHIHVKVTVPDRPTLTTQLYFPGPANAGDALFDPRLVVRDLRRRPAGWAATFTFALP